MPVGRHEFVKEPTIIGKSASKKRGMKVSRKQKNRAEKGSVDRRSNKSRCREAKKRE